MRFLLRSATQCILIFILPHKHVVVVQASLSLSFSLIFFLNFATVSHLPSHIHITVNFKHTHQILKYVMPCAIAYFYNPKFTKLEHNSKNEKKPIRKIAVQSPIRTVSEWVCRAPKTNAHTQFYKYNWRSSQILCIWLVGWLAHTRNILLVFFFCFCDYLNDAVCFALLFAIFLLPLSLSLGCFYIDFELCTSFCGSTNQSHAAHIKMTIVKLINFHIETYIDAVILYCIVMW